MPDAKTICNLGLGKIGANRINSLTPPKTVLEALCASGFPQWRDSELKKRRWVFAMSRVVLAPTGASPLAGLARPYQFSVPADCLRPLRPRENPWEQRGQFLYSTAKSIDLEYIKRVADTDMTDPNFIDVLSWRVAQELVEPATQSNEKWNKVQVGYQQAINEAAGLNAFVLEPMPFDAPDSQFTWVDERINMYG